ncbi:hemolymph lipopolysaccharide-binding protein-like [Zootermopsis nevadensis]|uniref:hemolymph lipopolysaccharide-binding protein-like n=1 Tax=Zootermopsis nevadensis TaxID=136037 RepID=UPI000B8E5EA0|nr:hemolymph lipopolysaccharide-binding protein-like [Zootermopsis nevadensis]
MRFAVFATFGLALAVSADRGSNCVEPRSNSMKFSLVSQKNTTGQWTAQLQLIHDGRKTDERSSWEVDLEQSVISCNGQERINLTATLTAPPEPPTPGYELFPRMGYYKFHPTGHIWKDALSVCMQEGAHLAIINSKAEANLIKGLFARYLEVKSSTDNNHAFLGYHDHYNEGQYETILGQPLNSTGYYVFTSGQPNNAAIGIDPDQDCGGVTREGLLNDLPCNTRYAFFCEMELP